MFGYVSAPAAESVSVSGSNLTWVVIVAVVGLLALGVAGVLVREVLAASQGTQRMQEIAHSVQGTDEVGIPAGFGLAEISGLADDVHVSSTSSGVSVRMSWPSATAPA